MMFDKGGQIFFVISLFDIGTVEVNISYFCFFPRSVNPHDMFSLFKCFTQGISKG